DGSAIAVTVTAGAPRLSGCRLIHNRFSAMEISGISRPVVEHSRLEGATSGGVLIMGKAQPRFTGNLFVDLRPFHIQSSSAYRIDARGNVWTPAATASTVLGDVDYSDVPE
ncbi:MAG: right-handed parallel beta-helix repeat-containing protein, partial [Gammaproteobacteria bacterium]